jgi:activating signal cointegrator 1
MAAGAKRIETRSWSTDYRGLVAIHAAKKWDMDQREQCMAEPFYERLFGDDHFEHVAQLPRGCFVALGRLHRVLSTTEYAPAIPSMDTDEYWFGDYSAGRFMWVFDGIWKLSSPVYATGQRGLWTLDEPTKDVIFALLPDGVEMAA